MRGTQQKIPQFLPQLTMWRAMNGGGQMVGPHLYHSQLATWRIVTKVSLTLLK